MQLLKRIKSQKMTIPTAHKNEKQREHSFIVGEKAKGYSHYVR